MGKKEQVPARAIFVQVLSSAAGGIFFREFEQLSPLDALRYACGMAMAISGIAALSLAKGSNGSTCGGNGELDPSYIASNVDETPGSPPFARTGASAGVSIRGIVPEVVPLVLSARFAFRRGAPTGGDSMRRYARRRSGTVGRGYDSDYHFIPPPRRLSAPLGYRSDYH
mmetsp:Transcript_34239/g.114283  ORF Transcript_34239/g.114283 Transcript_34239/m.114283 type:complete len:169 (-) Transcript_34239:31-537(-)